MRWRERRRRRIAEHELALDPMLAVLAVRENFTIGVPPGLIIEPGDDGKPYSYRLSGTPLVPGRYAFTMGPTLQVVEVEPVGSAADKD